MLISLDTEYTEKNVRKAELLSVSIGTSSTEHLFKSDDLVYYRKPVQDYLNKATIIFVQNGVVDAHILERYDFAVPKHKFIDCMLLEHLIDERLSHGLGDMALRYFNDNYKNDFWKEYSSFQEAPIEVADIYERKDARYTFDLGVRFMEQLSGKLPLIQHVHNLQWALNETEMQGLLVNRGLMERTKDSMSKEIAGYLSKLRDAYGEYCKVWELQEWTKQLSLRKTEKGKLGVKKPEFSFASDKQIQWLIYDAMECPITSTTKKKKPSTAYETIKELSETYPELQLLAEYKDTKAVYSTFVEGMLERVESDNKIYPSFYINGTATGRISHSNPNMGNLPRDGVVRNFFIPSVGNSLVGADYSQLEVVVEANLTEDKNTLKIILEGASKHDITAQGLGISRDQAKVLNFALGYGAGVHKVSKLLGISFNEADLVYNKYQELYSGVKALKEKTFKELEETGCVTNLFGRTRHFEKPKNEYERARQERQAYNFLVQGVGADITNMATYKVANRLKAEKMGRMLFSVHDEILCEVSSIVTDRAKVAIVEEMEGVNDFVNFKYPVKSKPYGPLPYWSKT